MNTVTIVILQAVLIIGLIVQRAQRRRAEQVVRTNEAALRKSYAHIRDLAGRLISAQEAERSRIARDLHDDACQEVAGVAVDISNLRRRSGYIRDADVQLALAALHNRAAHVAESLRLLSHDLHPGVLQHIGLVAALEAHCVEVERHHDVQVHFSAGEDVEPGSPAVALSLFRIAQETLRNASKHGRARHVAVALSRRNNSLMLTVADDGSGFDPAVARQNGGLGLVSIEERARLLKGDVTIHSRPQRGTTINVRVPVTVDGAIATAQRSTTT